MFIFAGGITTNRISMKNRTLIFLLLNVLFCCGIVAAEEVKKSSFEQRAESEDEKANIAGARFYYIRAFEDYAAKGNMKRAVDCGTKAVALYYKKENYYKEAFDLLRRIDQTIIASKPIASKAAALHYYTTKQRLQMYIKLRRVDGAKDQLKIMESQASTASDETITNDLLYTKAIYYYTFGLNEKGNAVFKEMAEKLTAKKDYDKVDEVYQTLIANGRRSNNASMVAQSYKNYMAWKDSVSAKKTAAEIDSLKQQITTHEETIADKDSSLSARRMVIIGLAVLAVALAAALVLGALVFMRFVVLTRKQKKTIKQLNESNALKAQFISNISAQLEPTLKKLDKSIPEVKALQDFSQHIQTLSHLESVAGEKVELEDTPVPPLCEGLMNEIRGKERNNVTLKVNAPQMSASINKEYVTHILRHLLANAAEYTPEMGSITLEYRKRGAHKFQFLVTNTGQTIPEERRDEVFKPFVEVKDLAKGDGLGLPICRQMAQNMGGDLTIDPEYTKGTRFVLDLYA